MMLRKIVLSLISFILMTSQTFAKSKEQNRIDFPILADELLKGEIHYYFSILTPQKLAVQHADVFELDSLSLVQENNVRIVLTKTAYVVNKPVGFFDDKQLSDEKYVSHVMGEQKVKKTGPATFQITIPNGEGISYKMQDFYDADDVSTLPNSKIIRAVNAVKKIDVISKGASTIQFIEKTNFSKNLEGGVSASSFIPMNEKKTLIITYNLYAVHDKVIDEKTFRQNFLVEAEAVKRLQESYK